MKPDKKVFTVSEALEKARKLCAKQERSHQYIRNKLYDWGIGHEHIEPIIAQLISEDFLNEERFVKAFAIGKFHQLRWGKQKIYVGLQKQKIDKRQILRGLAEIPDDEYLETLKTLFEKKQKQVKSKNQFIKNKRIANYLISKGFESYLVWDIIRKSVN